MLVIIIKMYRKIPFRPKCRCNHVDGRSCSRRTLDLALAGGATVGIVLAAATGCNSNSGNSNPCMPNDPNNPNSCSTPAPPPANSDAHLIGGHVVTWHTL